MKNLMTKLKELAGQPSEATQPKAAGMKLNKAIALLLATMGLALGAQADEVCTDCLTFSADKPFGLTTWALKGYAKPNPFPNLQYSTDQKNWETFNGDSAVSAVQAEAGAEYKIYLRGNDNTRLSIGNSKDGIQYFCITNTPGSEATAIACSGNIETLLDYKTVAAGNHPTMGENAYRGLFLGFKAMTTAPTLPATNLTACCYASLFAGCTSLKEAPELPATTLAENCYEYMFRSWYVLKEAPKLPATNLASNCYLSMFEGCHALEKAPELPATNLAKACYDSMFIYCTSLKEAPKLPAMTLAETCYSMMFKGCTALEVVPTLSATNLASKCYLSMFEGCTALTKAPTLPAKKLTERSYNGMFKGCTALKTIPELNLSFVTNWSCQEMFIDCSSLVVNMERPGVEWKIPEDVKEQFDPPHPRTGRSYYWATNMFKNTSGTITNSWNIEPGKTYYIASAPVALNVTAVDNATFQTYTNGAPADVPCTVDYIMPVKVVYTADEGYMFPGGYKTFTTNIVTTARAATVTVTLPAEQKPVVVAKCEDCLTFSAADDFGIKMWKKRSPTVDPSLEYSTDQIYWETFNKDDGAAAGADHKLYLRGTGNKAFASSTINAYCFTNTSASAATAIACSGNIETLLDYQTVAAGEHPVMEGFAFVYLFNAFARLTEAPNLPATNLVESCYYTMFFRCTSLTEAPELPATNLAANCYCSMFKGCTSLTAVPNLPATNLAASCYNSMFSGCTSLTEAPELPAKSLADSCYFKMFDGCSSLTAAPELPAKNLAARCYYYMFNGCTSLTDLPDLPATNLSTSCYNGMFKDCTSLVVNTNAPGKAWSIPAEAATSAAAAETWNKDMFNGTSGDITNTTVTCGVTYYVASALMPVTVEVPEVAGATAQLLAFNVNGGWKSVATNEVPSNATVRVLWTAADGKGLNGEGAANAFQWMATFVADKAVQTAPAPEVVAAGEGSVTIDYDSRATKQYFDKKDILPIWYAAGTEVKVKGENEQSWKTIVRGSATTNTVSWVPAADDTYTLTQNGFDAATIVLTTPVEVTTNDLEVAGTTVEVTVGGVPIEPQTEEPYAGKLMVPSNSTVKAVYTVVPDGKYFMDGTRTYEQTFVAGKAVNEVAEMIEKPQEPQAPSVQLGMVAQRYPWNGILDVQYWAKNTPNEGYTITVTVTLPSGTKGVKTLEASEKHDCRNGKNVTEFNVREAFGEVQILKGVKVRATLEKAAE